MYGIHANALVGVYYQQDASSAFTRATVVAVQSTVVFACSIFIGAMSFRQLLLFIYSIHVYFTSCRENNNTKSSQLRANSAFDRNRKQHLVASEVIKKEIN